MNKIVLRAFILVTIVFTSFAASFAQTITVPPGGPLSFSAIVGDTSAVQSYSVYASGLNDSLVITAPAEFQVSTTSGSGFTGSVVLYPTGGDILPTAIYVRYVPAAAGNTSGDIVHTSTGAISQNVPVAGSAVLPQVTVNGGPLSFITTAGIPSAPQSYSVSGTNLLADIVITSPTGFQISRDTISANFGSSLTLTQTNHIVNQTTIYARLNGGGVGPSAGDITHTSSGAVTQTVHVTGTTNPAPSITITQALIPFTSTAGLPSAEQTYTVSGSNLTGDITVTAPADFQVSLSSSSGFGPSVTLAPISGSVGLTQIHVQFNRATGGTSSGNITNATPGTTTQNVAVTGTASNPVPGTLSISPSSTTVNGPGFALTVNGSNFVNGSTVQFNGAPRTTTFVSSSQLTATIPATDLTAVGTFNITVVSASPGGGTSNAQTLTVTPGPLDHFIVESSAGGSIGTQTAGSPFTIRVTAKDAFGNTVTAFNGTAVITSTGTLSSGAGTTALFSNGVLSSHSVTITNTGASFTITATRSSGSESGTSNAFAVNPGTLHHFAVRSIGDGDIGTQTAGQPFGIKVTAEDQFNNIVTGFSGTVDITSTGSLSAGGGTTAAFAAGVLASHSVTISNVGSFTITARRTSGGPQSGTSNSFTVNPGGVAGFLVESAAGGNIPSQIAGVPFSIKITAHDVNNNTVTGFTGTVSLTSVTGGLVGSPLTSGTFINGVLASQSVTLTIAGPSHTITAASGPTTGTSNAFTVTPGAPSAATSTITANPISIAANGTSTSAITVQLKDASGNNLSTGTPVIVLATSLGTLSPVINNGNGTFSATLTSVAVVGTASITGTLDGTAMASSASVQFTVGAASAATTTVDALPTSIPANGTSTATVTVQLKDAAGNNLPAVGGNVVTLTTSHGTLSAPADIGGGRISAVLTSSTSAGIAVIHGVLNSTPIADSAVVSFTAGTLARFLVEHEGGGAIGTQTAGTPFNLRITAQDLNGNTVTGFTGTVDITSTGILTAGGGTTVAFSSGVLASHSVTLSSTGTFNITATRTGGSESGASNNFTVGAAAAAQLVYVTMPSTVAAGAPIAPPVTVQLHDQFGNAVSSAGVPVTLSMVEGTGALSGTLVQNTNASGVATFGDVSINLAGPKRLRVTSGALTHADTGIVVTSAAPGGLAFITTPNTSVAGSPLAPAPVVALQDPFGNIVTGTAQTVTVAIFKNAGAGVILSGTATVPVNTETGLATFPGLSINRSGTGYTLTAIGSTVSTVAGTTESGTFDILPGARHHLQFAVQPSNAPAGAAITPAVQVQVEDSLGNGVPDSGVAVTMSIDAGTLGGILTQSTAAGGRAVFADLHSETPGARTLTANSAGLLPAVSTPFTVSPGAPAKLAFTTQPGNGTAGIPLPTQPVVTLQDAFGNTVTGVAQRVTLSLHGTTPPGAVLGGTNGVDLNPATGQAVFADLFVNIAGSAYALQAVGSTVDTAHGIVVSSSFAVVPAAPTQVTVETAADGTGTPLGRQNVSSGTSITVHAVSRDAFGNFVANVQADPSGWQLIDVTGGVLPTDLVPSADRRSATFTARVVGSARIVAASAGLIAVPTDTIHVVTAGAPAVIQVETAANGMGTLVPAQTLVSGASLRLYSVARDAAGNFVANVAAQVWLLRDTTGGVSASDLVPSPDRKSAVFTSRRVGTGRVEADSGGVAPILSGILTVRHGAAASVAAAAGTPQSARVNTQFSTALAARVLDAAGNPVFGIAVTFSAPSSGPGGTFLGGSATRTTDSSGVSIAPPFTGNTVAGDYFDTARVAGVATPALYSLSNTPGPPAAIVATAGTPQSAQVSTAFPVNLSVVVHDAYGNLVSGVIVRFTAPATGASGTFVAGRDTAVTGANGSATAALFVANIVAGTYQISANTTPPVASPALFTLTNTSGPVGGITATAGSGQSATVNTNYAVRLAATVRDASGNPVPGVAVTFTAPGTGPTARFASGAFADTSTTDVSGVAQASIIRANSVAGNFSIVATAAGVGSPASFSLTNTAAALDTFIVESAAGGAIGTQVVRVPFAIRVTARDVYGNTATSFTGRADISATGLLSAGGGPTAQFTAGVLASHTVAMGTAGNFSIIATRSGGAEFGRSNPFTVTNPVPTLVAIVPSNGRVGQRLTVAVHGTGFIAGVTSVAFGDRITTLSTVINNDSLLTVVLQIDTSAQSGARTVTVINAPAGGSSSLVGGFTVGDIPAPTLVSLQPSSGNQLQALTVVFRGTNFLGGVTTADFGTGITVRSLTVDSTTQLSAAITITAAASLGVHNVTVTNTPGGTSAPQVFTVTPAALAAPVLAGPATASKNQAASLVLRWFRVPGATGYTVQVSAGSGFQSLLVNDSTVTDTTKQVGPLASPGTYFWRVRSKNTGGAGAFSTTWSFSTANPASIALDTSVPFPVLPSAGSYKATDYRLVGLPGASNAPATTYVAGSAGTDWQMYWDNGAAASFLVAYDGSATFTFAPGRAFWLIRKGAWTVNATVPSVAVDTSGNASIDLHPGWNLITNPFVMAVPWSAVQAANGNFPEPLYEFGGTTLFSTTGTLSPYAGYYFDNTGNLDSLKVPAVGGALKTDVAADTLGWRMSITMSSHGLTDRDLLLGVVPGTVEGPDRLDFRKPRPFGDLPSISFSRPEWGKGNDAFAADLRPEVTGKALWPFDVHASVHDEVLLTFEGVQRIPSELQVYLVDKARGRSVNLRTRSDYAFHPVANVTTLAVLVGTTESIQSELDDLLPREFALGANYPNPFNPSTTIPVAVPFRADVDLAVYNVIGQKVRTIHAGPLDAGRHWFVWDGNNDRGSLVASGVYLIRMSTGAGKQFVGKMLMMK